MGRAATSAVPDGLATEIRYVQLGNGRCRTRQASLRTPCMDVRYEAWSLAMLKLARVPRDAVTLLVPVSRGGASRIQGRRVSPGDVVMVLGGEELDYRSVGAAKLLTVSFQRAALEEHVRSVLARSLGAIRFQGRLSPLRAEAAAVRRLCRVLTPLREDGRGNVVHAVLGRRRERELVRVLLGGVGTQPRPEGCSPGRSLARRAELLLRQNILEPPTIHALCTALAASERTLHQAFRQHLNATPKAYVKTLRLNAARHDLMKGGDSTRVTDVALDWGFQHFGWFSQDYRRLFDESPSHTLQRGRKAGRVAAFRTDEGPIVIGSRPRLYRREGPQREKRA
jgi:AraC family transcriptional regulator, ethanolamine operon transcriptional activator